MKLTHKALLVPLLCAGFTQVIRPEKIWVKLYKTDPTTWNKPFYYDVATEQVTETIITGPIPKLTKGNAVKVARAKQKTPEIRTRTSVSTIAYKPIKKDMTISFDAHDENTLWVCPTPNHDERVCKKLILSTTPKKAEHEPYILGDVIAIDKDYKPVSMSKSDVNKLIKERQAEFFKIPVYKADPSTWGEKWTITLVDEKGHPYPEAQVDIYKDSKIKKLLIHKKIEPGKTFVRVRRQGKLYGQDSELLDREGVPWADRALAIGGDGKGTIVNKSMFKATPTPPRPRQQSELNQDQIELM